MTTAIALPQARIPLGWVMVQGQRVPVEIDQEWMLTFARLVERTGGTSGATSFTEYINQFFDAPPASAEAQDAVRGVDELRNTLESARGELQQLRGVIEDQAQELAALRPDPDLRARIEDLESQLASMAVPADLRNRIEQLEDRLQ